MAGDPNARRDKALESIARELGETNKLLKQIERNTRRVTFKNTPEREEPPTEYIPVVDPPTEMIPQMTINVQEPPPNFPEPVHPYLRRSPRPYGQ